MNEHTPSYQPSELELPPGFSPMPALPPGLDTAPLTEAERFPIHGVGGVIEALLRRPRGLFHGLSGDSQSRLTWLLVATAVVCAILYGLVAGTFSGGVQIYAAPLKIAGGLVVSAALCLPSLYVFGCLSGASARLGEVAGIMAGFLALTLVLLFSFAPVAWVFSQSTQSVGTMGTIHVLFWLAAVGFGGRLLLRGMRISGARSVFPFQAWIVLFVFVTLQLATALRPIIGRAPEIFPHEKKFFLTHWGDTFSSSLAPSAGR